jgi:flagellar hook-basal body complex protein FliE
MDAAQLGAVNAYKNQLKLQQEAQAMPVQDEAVSGTFSQFLKGVATDAIDNQYKAESIQMEALTGKVEISDLVTAVSSAELTLNTVVAIRDRVISAYQEILRMPI